MLELGGTDIKNSFLFDQEPEDSEFGGRYFLTLKMKSLMQYPYRRVFYQASTVYKNNLYSVIINSTDKKINLLTISFEKMLGSIEFK